MRIFYTEKNVLLGGLLDLLLRAWLLTSSVLLLADSPGFTVRTIAGSNLVGDGAAATAAILSQTEGIAVDGKGGFYVVDADDCRIRHVAASGQIQTVAGTGVAGFNGDAGPGAMIQLNNPYGLAIDGLGNLFVADLGNARVRKLTPDGTLTTVAGGGSKYPGWSTEGVPAASIILKAPRNVAVDRNGNLYISDFGANQIYRVDPGGAFSIVAGTANSGFAGDGGLAKNANLSAPAGLVLDASGALYFADSGNGRVRQIINGTINTLLQIPSPTGLAMNASGTLYVAASGYFGTITRAVGQGLTARDVAVDADGTIYLTGNNTVRRIGTDGSVTVVAGSGASRYYGGDGGPAASARLHNPAGVVVDDLGNVYISDTDNQRIRKISTNGIMTTFAGTGEQGSLNPAGNALLAQLNGPRGLALDSMRNLYVADTANKRVCKITPSGTIVVVIDKLNQPEAVVVDGHDSVYIADTGGGQVLMLTATGVVSTVAQGLRPAGLAIDKQGNLYLSESTRISKMSNSGALSTVLDGLKDPRGLTLTTSGDLVIAETGAHRVQVLSSTGAVITYGTGIPGFAGDDGDAHPLQFSSPTDVGVDSAGHIVIADTGNQRIRVLTPAVDVGPSPLNVPTVTILNGASLMPGPITPNEIVTIFGAGFDPVKTQVLFDGTPAVLFYVGPSQINALVPASLTPGRNSSVAIDVNGVQIAAVVANVSAFSPAFFTVQGGAQAAALNEDGSYNSDDNAAARGSIVTLYATGLSQVPPVSVTVGGYTAEVLYAGAAPGYSGLLQINVRVPSGFLPPGDQPVVLNVNGFASQAGVTIAVK
jgi:uncharacterized protein (TIGR03437 family)